MRTCRIGTTKTSRAARKAVTTPRRERKRPRRRRRKAKRRARPTKRRRERTRRKGEKVRNITALQFFKFEPHSVTPWVPMWTGPNDQTRVQGSNV